MDELEKLKAKLAKKVSALKDARLSFDLEMRDYLLEEIYELQQRIYAIEQEREE